MASSSPCLLMVEEELNEFKKDFDQRNYRVSNQKLESLGWTANYSLDHGVQELLKGYKMIVKFKNKDFTNL